MTRGMEFKELAPIGPKTTMRIGGQARWYGEILTKEDSEQAVAFAKEQGLPLVLLGGGSNTIFSDSVIDAVVVRMKASSTMIDGNTVTVQGGVILGSLINELAEKNLDLSALTGIPGTIGGAIVGNAGQGPKGIWIDAFVESVEAFVEGQWRTFTKEECQFEYRESVFKHWSRRGEPLGRLGTDSAESTTPVLSTVEGSPIRQAQGDVPPIIWQATLVVPSRPEAEVKAEVERLIQKRIETQPHLRTAGSCFKAVGGTPAWQLLDAAGLRGKKFGGVEIAQKHANFLLNDGTATYTDAITAVEAAKNAVPDALEVEMRFIEPDGSVRY